VVVPAVVDLAVVLVVLVVAPVVAPVVVSVVVVPVVVAVPPPVQSSTFIVYSVSEPETAMSYRPGPSSISNDLVSPALITGVEAILAVAEGPDTVLS
jgi:hypothetical protein